jgi:hypothetical protein
MAYYGGSPAELVVLVISLGANLLTIADIVAKRLHRGHSSSVRFDEKEIKLEGKWKPSEIARIVTTIVSPTSRAKALNQIEKIKSLNIAETKASLVSLEATIRDYEKLIQGFNDIPRQEAWQKKRVREYTRKLDKLRKERDQLSVFIAFLQHN